jgi:hypothetical protein
VRVTQRGLPPGVPLEVNVVNTRTGVKLGEVDVVSSSAGTIDVQLPASLRDVQQVVVEVERRSDETELGEVGADLPQPCSTTPQPLHPLTASTAPSPATTTSATAAPAPIGPVARPPDDASSPPSSAAPSAPSSSPSSGDDGWGMFRLLVLIGALVVGAALARRRFRLPRRFW